MPTKAKKAPSPREVRLTLLDTNPVFQCLGDIHNSCRAMTGSSTRGKSSAIKLLCVYAITIVKKICEQDWSSSLCIIFFQFWHFTDSPKTALPHQNKNTYKELSQNEACSLGIRTQYWTDLQGIALTNNKFNVTMADLRHWGLVLICILYTAWHRSLSADIFAPVHDEEMSTQFLCAQSCTANIFVYVKVHAPAKCDLFQPYNYIKRLRKLKNKILVFEKSISTIWSFLNFLPMHREDVTQPIQPIGKVS